MGYVMYIGEKRLHTDFTGAAWRRGTLDRPTSRWEDNIKMNVNIRAWGGINWINLLKDNEQ